MKKPICLSSGTLLLVLTMAENCFARGVPVGEKEMITNILMGSCIVLMLCSMAYNVSWWLYGKTLSEMYPPLVVLLIMLTTLCGFFFSFKFLFVTFFGWGLPDDWGYMTEYDVFVPYSRDIGHVFAGVSTIAIAVLLYRDEGKIYGSKWTENSEKGLKHEDK